MGERPAVGSPPTPSTTTSSVPILPASCPQAASPNIPPSLLRCRHHQKHPGRLGVHAPLLQGLHRGLAADANVRAARLLASSAAMHGTLPSLRQAGGRYRLVMWVGWECRVSGARVTDCFPSVAGVQREQLPAVPSQVLQQAGLQAGAFLGWTTQGRNLATTFEPTCFARCRTQSLICCWALCLAMLRSLRSRCWTPRWRCCSRPRRWASRLRWWVLRVGAPYTSESVPELHSSQRGWLPEHCREHGCRGVSADLPACMHRCILAGQGTGCCQASLAAASCFMAHRQPGRAASAAAAMAGPAAGF